MVTPLMHACEWGSMNTIASFLNEGADVNKQDIDGYAAIAYALDCEEQFKIPEIINTLIIGGADVTLKNSYDETALERAAKNKLDSGVIELLTKATNTLSATQSNSLENEEKNIFDSDDKPKLKRP